jgi:predicted HAD superfamily phosphohydrolase YqeG
MKRQKAVFDVDCTLITMEDKPNYKVIDFFKMLESFGFEMYIHSGGGCDYARHWAEKLGLNAIIVAKGCTDIEFDIAVDDAIDPFVGEEEGHKFYIHTKLFIKV